MAEEREQTMSAAEQATRDYVRAETSGVRLEIAEQFGRQNTAIAEGFGKANTAIANISKENAERASRHLLRIVGTIITGGILATAFLAFLMRLWTL